jgi:hypothetical protein
VFGVSLPRCRSHLSDMKARSKETTVTAPIAMNSGFSFHAPMFEINLLTLVLPSSHRCHGTDGTV